MSLWSDFLGHDGWYTMKFNHYFPVYQRHFSRFINLDVTIFEIGVYQGGSLQLWKKYLGPHAKVVGIDIDPQCAGIEEDQIFIRIGDQSDPKFLDALLEEFSEPDIVIDDGSHQPRHVNFTFDYLYPRQRKNSVYVVEDTGFGYWEELAAGGEDEAFIQRTKALIDLLHANHTRGRIASNCFAQMTGSIHVYDSMVVFEKQSTNRRFTVAGKSRSKTPLDNPEWVEHVRDLVTAGSPELAAKAAQALQEIEKSG